MAQENVAFCIARKLHQFYREFAWELALLSSILFLLDIDSTVVHSKNLDKQLENFSSKSNFLILATVNKKFLLWTRSNVGGDAAWECSQSFYNYTISIIHKGSLINWQLDLCLNERKLIVAQIRSDKILFSVVLRQQVFPRT